MHTLYTDRQIDRYVCICACIYACMCLCVYIHACMHACVSSSSYGTHTRVCQRSMHMHPLHRDRRRHFVCPQHKYTHIHTHTHMCVCINVCVCVCDTYVCVCVCMYINSNALPWDGLRHVCVCVCVILVCVRVCVCVCINSNALPWDGLRHIFCAQHVHLGSKVLGGRAVWDTVRAVGQVAGYLILKNTLHSAFLYQMH